MARTRAFCNKSNMAHIRQARRVRVRATAVNLAQFGAVVDLLDYAWKAVGELTQSGRGVCSGYSPDNLKSGAVKRVWRHGHFVLAGWTVILLLCLTRISSANTCNL